MLPNSSVEEGEEETRKTSKSVRLDFETGEVGEMIDTTEALKQAIHIAIMTQRYKYAIFPHSYGTELENAFDDGYMMAMGNVKNAICDSLLCDDRINSIDDFEFEKDDNKMKVKFRISTIWGDIAGTEEIENVG